MIGKDIQDGELEIEDENLIFILIDWLPYIQSDLQRWTAPYILRLHSIWRHNLPLGAILADTTNSSFFSAITDSK